MEKKQVLVLDFETTGLDPNRHRPVEVAAILAEGDTIIEEWSTRIRPADGGEVDPGALAVNGIRMADLDTAPHERDVFGKLNQLLQTGAVVVAHHAPFDLAFLLAGLQRSSYPVWDGDFLCTRSLFALVSPGEPAGLAAVTNKLGVPLGKHHCALDDARATFGILRYLLPVAQKVGIEPLNMLVRHPDRPLTWVPPRAIIVDGAEKGGMERAGCEIVGRAS